MISTALRSFRGSVLAPQFAHLVRHSIQNVRCYSAAAAIEASRRKKAESVSQAGSGTMKTLDVIRETVTSKDRLQFDMLAGYVESLNEPLTSENLRFLFECIGRNLPQVPAKQKAELITELWRKVKTWKSPNADEYVSWLRALRESRAVISWDEIKRELSHLEPCMKLYEELLYLVSAQGQPQETVEVLAQIKEQEFPLTEKIFHALIVAHSRDQNVQSVESVLELMSTANLTPNSETQFEMARAYISNGLWQNAEEIIQLAEFSTRQILEILKNVLAAPIDDDASKGMRDHQISTLVNKLPLDVLRHKEISPLIKNFLIEQMHVNKRPEDVLRIMKLLPKPPKVATENDDAYGAFILNELLDTNQPFAVVKSFCDFLVDDDRNARAPFVVTEIALRRNSPHSLDLLRFLATKEPLRPHYFWPLFINEFNVNGEQGVLDLIAEMKSLNVPFDPDTISLYILPRTTLILKDLKAGVQLLADAGVKVAELMVPVAMQLLATQKYEDFQKLFNTFPTQVNGDQFLSPLAKSTTSNEAKAVMRVLKTIMEKTKLPPNSDVNGSFLIELVNMNKFEPLKALLGELNQHKIRISPTAKSRVEERIKTAKNLTPELRKILFDTLLRLNTNDAAVPLPGMVAYLESKHPKDMNFNELEGHLAELEEKQFNTRGVLRKMLQMAVKEKRYQEALKLKEKCDAMAVDYSAGMLASCVELYTRTEKVDEARGAWYGLEAKFPSFVIDEHKAIDFAHLLIKDGQPEEAREVLRARAKKKVIGENNNKNIWNLLSTVCEKAAKEATGEENLQTKSFLNFLIKHKYCGHSNTLLGPLVREWLLKKDLRKAVAEFKDIVKKHRKTPLNLELLTVLVEKKNGIDAVGYGEISETEIMDMISEVFKAVELVHGLTAAKTSLLFATAEGGTEKQVRKILMDPNVRVDPQAMLRQCEYLGRAGKTEPLFRLIKSCRGLSHNIINENQLWCTLMQTLAKQNNVEEAVRLFNRLLEEDEIKVNKQIAEIVIDLLRRNNLELPSRLQTFSG